MKKTLSLSIIVPVYNVAPYLEACLNSLVAQELADIEIIIVDDGSTDEGPAILARFAEAYPDCLRVIRQENKGLSGARNTGLDLARGEYVAFVDSDDWIEPGYYRRLLRMARDNKLDMAHGNAIFHFEGRKTDHPIYQDDLTTEVMAGRDVLRKRLASQNFLHMVWMHLYRRDFVEEQKFRFIEGLIHEDVLWTTRAFLQAERVAYDPTPGYFYRLRIRRFNAADSDTRLEKIITSSVVNASGLAEMVAKIPDDDELCRLIQWQLVDGGMSIFHKMRQIKDAGMRQRISKVLKEKRVFQLLWRNATSFVQHKRIARHWLLSLVRS